MGPNGSGKCTLSHVIMGRPGYEVLGGSVTLDGVDLLGLAPWERAQAGLFLAMQYPTEVPGVARGRRARGGLRRPRAATRPASPTASAPRPGASASTTASSHRAMNVDLSGGEKKRNETLQLGVLEPAIAILDELDSGLDVDALRACARRIEAATEETGLGVLAITHYNRLLHELHADHVHVLVRRRDPALRRARAGRRARAHRLRQVDDVRRRARRALDAIPSPTRSPDQPGQVGATGAGSAAARRRRPIDLHRDPSPTPHAGDGPRDRRGAARRRSDADVVLAAITTVVLSAVDHQPSRTQVGVDGESIVEVERAGRPGCSLRPPAAIRRGRAIIAQSRLGCSESPGYRVVADGAPTAPSPKGIDTDVQRGRQTAAAEASFSCVRRTDRGTRWSLQSGGRPERAPCCRWRSPNVAGPSANSVSASLLASGRGVADCRRVHRRPLRTCSTGSPVRRRSSKMSFSVVAPGVASPNTRTRPPASTKSRMARGSPRRGRRRQSAGATLLLLPPGRTPAWPGRRRLRVRVARVSACQWVDLVDGVVRRPRGRRCTCAASSRGVLSRGFVRDDRHRGLGHWASAHHDAGQDRGPATRPVTAARTATLRRFIRCSSIVGWDRRRVSSLRRTVRHVGK